MAASLVTAGAAADLYHDDFSDDDPFADDNPTGRARDDKDTASPRGTKRKSTDDAADFIGVNEEVQIKKKRKPTVKLDENRLLSAAGIPKLRAIARSSSVTRKLRMKGKGHEFSDVARLLNFYQLWLDGLYPRAKFADGLELIEKVGHSKRMQVMRKEWIDEGKPGYITPGTELVESILRADEHPTLRVGENGQPLREPAPVANDDDVPPDEEAMFFPSPSKATQQKDASEDPDDDELDALLAMQEDAPVKNAISAAAHDDSEGEDDLDALLAEQDSRRNGEPGPMPKQSMAPPDEDDEDDLDALLAEQDARHAAPAAPVQAQINPASSSRPSSRDSSSKKKHTIFDDSDSENDGEDDATTLPPLPKAGREITPPTSPALVMNGESSLVARETPSKPLNNSESQGSEGGANIFSSSPIQNEVQEGTPGKNGSQQMKTYSSSPLPNNPEEEDDLDALLAEADM